MEEFTLGSNEFIELNSLLKVIGLCDSGGMAKTAIAEGRVKVDGNVELRKVKLVKGKLLNLKVIKLLSNNDWLRIAGNIFLIETSGRYNSSPSKTCVLINGTLNCLAIFST